MRRDNGGEKKMGRAGDAADPAGAVLAAALRRAKSPALREWLSALAAAPAYNGEPLAGGINPVPNDA